jgi:hypothetical protein
VNTDGLAVTDATFEIGATTYTADDCYGLTDTGASNIADVLTFVNDNLTNWDDFDAGVKDNAGGGSDAEGTVTISGIQFTLTTTTLTGSGGSQFQEWTLSWVDQAGAPDLPMSFDFVAIHNTANTDALYLFEDVIIPASPTMGTGTIDIKIMNKKGNDQGTSHMTLLFREGIPTTSGATTSGQTTSGQTTNGATTSGQELSAPGSPLALLALGLGLWFLVPRRRKLAQ